MYMGESNFYYILVNSYLLQVYHVTKSVQPMVDSIAKVNALIRSALLHSISDVEV